MAIRKKFQKNERGGGKNLKKGRRNDYKDKNSNFSRKEDFAPQKGRRNEYKEKTSKFNEKSDFSKRSTDRKLHGRNESSRKETFTNKIGESHKMRKQGFDSLAPPPKKNSGGKGGERAITKMDKSFEKNLENVSQLRQIYFLEENDEEIVKFSENVTKDILKEEISYLGYLVKQKEFDRTLSSFMIEIISKCIDSTTLANFLNIVFRLLEVTSLKQSVFHLKIIQNLLNISFYIPVGLKLLSLFKLTLKMNELTKINKKVDYEKIKVTSEYLSSEELKSFISEESLALLFTHLNSISDSLGFPEISCHILRELKEIKEDNMDLKDLIERVEEQVAIITEKRKGVAFTNEKDIREFELSTNKMIS